MIGYSFGSADSIIIVRVFISAGLAPHGLNLMGVPHIRFEKLLDFESALVAIKTLKKEVQKEDIREIGRAFSQFSSLTKDLWERDPNFFMYKDLYKIHIDKNVLKNKTVQEAFPTSELKSILNEFRDSILRFLRIFKKNPNSFNASVTLIKPLVDILKQISIYYNTEEAFKMHDSLLTSLNEVQPLIEDFEKYDNGERYGFYS